MKTSKSLTPSILLIFTTLCAVSLGAQTALSPGDIEIVLYNSFQHPDSIMTFAFIHNVPLAPGTQINFTDRGLNSDGSLGEITENEGTVRFTVPIGETLEQYGYGIYSPDMLTSPVVPVSFQNCWAQIDLISGNNGRFYPNVGGDQIIVYQGTAENPVVIYAISYSGSGWQTSASLPTDTCIPPGFLDNVDCFAFNRDLQGEDVTSIKYDISQWYLDYPPPLKQPVSKGERVSYFYSWFSHPQGLTVEKNKQLRDWFWFSARPYRMYTIGNNPFGPTTFYIEYYDPTLPVELSSFTATLSANSFVSLEWTTQSETGVLGYYIFRAVENRLDSALLISPLVNATNTSLMHSYNFSDHEIYNQGVYYYWLQSVDSNGNSHYFGPLYLLIISDPETPGAPELPKSTRLKAVFPNPFNPNTRIPFELDRTTNVNICIFNIRGQFIREFELGALNAGHHHIDWDGRNDRGVVCANGVYTIMMNADERVFRTKAILLK